jgi:2'-5' RNA ligase
VRLFVAAYPPAEAMDSLEKVVAGLHVGRAEAAGINARLAPRSRWHLTVGFLGDVEDERLPDVEQALRQGVDAWLAAAQAPVLRLAGGGRFGRGKFTILWAGVRGEVPALTALGVAVQRQLKRARLPYDDRPFRPHLTLARPGDRIGPAELAVDLQVLRGYEGPPWPADTLHLIRSHLGPHPTYDLLASYSLTGDFGGGGRGSA